MTKPANLVGRRFGRLTVLRRYHTSQDEGIYWLCHCKCGIEQVFAQSALENKEKRLRPRSCGCLHTESTKSKRALAQTTHGMSDDPLCRKWYQMQARNHKNLEIEWSDAEAFCDWAYSTGYKDGARLMRKDPNEGYTEENCYWKHWEGNKGTLAI